MDDTAPGDAPDCPAMFSQPVHQFHFIEVEEEAVVEESGLAQRIHAKHRARAGDPVDFWILTVIHNRRLDSKQPSERFRLDGVQEFAARRRKTERRCAWTLAGVDQLASGRTAA